MNKGYFWCAWSTGIFTSRIQLGRSSGGGLVLALLVCRLFSSRHGHTQAQGHAVLPEQSPLGPRWANPSQTRPSLADAPVLCFSRLPAREGKSQRPRRHHRGQRHRPHLPPGVDGQSCRLLFSQGEHLFAYSATLLSPLFPLAPFFIHSFDLIFKQPHIRRFFC